MLRLFPETVTFLLLPGRSPQYKWLVADLAKVNRAVTPWLFVSFHEVPSA